MKKYILCLCFLLVVGATAFAQTKKERDTNVGYFAPREDNLEDKAILRPDQGYQVQVGDTVAISKQCTAYLTKQAPSIWVYYVRHVVGQIGSKRFPQGVLLKDIMSWVDPQYVFLVGARDKTDAALERERLDRDSVNQTISDMDNLTEEERNAIRDMASRHNATPLTPYVDNTTEQQQDTVASVKEEQEMHEMVADTTVQCNFDRLTIGLRGSAASFMRGYKEGYSNSKKIGYDALLDIQYAHYWQKAHKPALGLIVGVSAGYMQHGYKGAINDVYTQPTDYGDILYSVQSDCADEANHQIQVEVPLMFSMITEKGFFLNVGPRFMLPVWTNYRQDLTQPKVTAYFNDEDVAVENEVITGIADQSAKGKWTSAKVNIMATLELGYEWQLNNGGSLSLGAFADYSCYSLYANKNAVNSIISIMPPSADGVAIVNQYSAADAYTSKMGFFDAGIKLAYHFNWRKQRDITDK